MAPKKKVLTNLTRKPVSAKMAKQVRGGRKAGEGQKDFLK
jgi:hypothetical protein